MELANADTAANVAREELFSEWAKVEQETPFFEEPVQLEDLNETDTRRNRDVQDHSRKSGGTSLTARIVPPKEYKYGDNFTTWCSRFRRYLRIGKIENTNLCEILLNNVDDRTLDKLEPIAEKLTGAERRDPDLFIPLFEKAMYPKSEIRALRQQLTNGQLVQETDEDVDSFASKLRSVAKRAYSEPSERQEPCLNAFLNGIRDLTLYDKVVAVPGAEEDFELAVDSARKFEKMRRTRSEATANGSSGDSLSVLRVSGTDSWGSRNNTENSGHDYSHERSYQNNNNRSHGGRPDQRQGGRQTGYHNRGRDSPRVEYDSRGRDSPQQRYTRDASRSSYNSRGRDGPRRETRTCYRCDEVGLIARNCPQNPLNSSRAGSSSQQTGPQQ